MIHLFDHSLHFFFSILSDIRWNRVDFRFCPRDSELDPLNLYVANIRVCNSVSDIVQRMLEVVCATKKLKV